MKLYEKWQGGDMSSPLDCQKVPNLSNSDKNIGNKKTLSLEFAELENIPIL